MYLLIVTWILIASGPAGQTPKPPTTPSISTDKVATYKSLNDCRKAAEAFTTDPADRDAGATGFSLITRTVCAPVPDGDAVAG
jgi:hypothetical protein